MVDSDIFLQQFRVRWSDLDANGHMRNTAYIEYAMQTRFAFLADRGFTPADFRKHGIGPVIFREEIAYFKEVQLLETIRVNHLLGSMNEAGDKFSLVNEVYNEGQVLAARIITHGTWLNLKTRKAEPPPPKLLQAMRNCVVYLPE